MIGIYDSVLAPFRASNTGEVAKKRRQHYFKSWFTCTINMRSMDIQCRHLCRQKEVNVLHPEKRKKIVVANLSAKKEQVLRIVEG